MERYFEVAKKIMGELVMKWDVDEEYLPAYKTQYSAGADFCAVEDTVIPSIWNSDKKGCKPTLVHTGIKVKMPGDEVLRLYNRSSGPMKGLVLANSVGVIDADYYSNPKNDGEIMFAFYNFMPYDVTIKRGDAIGQGVFEKILRANSVVNKDGERLDIAVGGERTGGFGSTNK